MANSQSRGIYKITSPNNKVYIGQSINIEKRWNDYLKLRFCKGQPKLYYSFKKYGSKNHKFEIIEKCHFEELNIKERYWQDFYNVLKEGLNCVLTCTNELPMKTSMETRIKKSNSLKQPILQYNLEGNFIKEWPSTNDAINQLNLSTIGQNITGEVNYSGNFIFRKKLEEDFPKHIIISAHLNGKYQIIQKDLNGVFIKEYPNVKQAILETQITSIYKCLRGKNKTSGGYLWEYKLKMYE
jgi:group I intron endonuclease